MNPVPEPEVRHDSAWRWARLLGRHPTAAAAGVLALLSLGLFADVLLAGPRVIASYEQGDALRYFLPIRDLGFSELASGNLMLWNPYVFSGTPFLGGFQSALLYPLNWIYLWLPVGTAIDLDLAIHVFLGGIFGYAWIAGRGIRPLAAFFGACVLVFGSAFFLRVLAGQLTLVAVVSWSPLLLLAVDRLIERPRPGWALVGIAATTLMILAGYPAAVYATGVAVGLSIAFQWRRFTAPLQSLSWLALVAIAPVFLAAAQLWPGLAAAGETLRADGVPLDFATSFSLPPENLVTLLAPSFFGDLTLFYYWGRWFYWDVTLYIGAVGIFLALHGAIRGEREQQRSAAWIAAILIVIALGSHTPVYALLHAWVPGFDSFRAPSKFALQASLFLAMLAAIGGDRLLASPRGARGLAIAAGAAAIGLAAAGVWAATTALEPEGWTLGALLREIETSDAPSFTWRRTTARKFGIIAGPFVSKSLWVSAAVAMAVAALLWRRARSPRWAVALLVVGCLEVFIFAATHRGRVDHEALRVVRMQSQIARLGPDERFFWAVADNRAVPVRGQSIWGYDPVMLARYAEFVARTQILDGGPLDLTVAYPSQFHPLYGLMRCALHLHLDASFGGEVDAMARFVLLRDHEVVADASERLARLVDPGFDWRRMVLLESEPGAPHAANSGLPPLDRPVHVLGGSTDHVDLELSIDEPALLLITDSYSEGWRAMDLDADPSEAAGRRYAIRPANHAQMAIPLGAGEHRIRLEYAPASVRLGRMASLAGGIAYAAAVGLWWWRRRSASESAEDPAPVADE